ncbi:hypothetical protein [Hyphomonas oceanitis]|uniref:hypothetical protein n=1 Tax=Hyphomonas oceanitis TaxID=81033 RepID=UPI0030026525
MAPMPHYSLFRPMRGLPWYLLPVWPLIYVQIRRLQSWFYANCGPESEMHWAVTRHGRVDLIRLSDDMCATPKHPWVPIQLSHSFNTALMVEMPTPHPCPRRTPGPQAMASEQTARDPGVRREFGCVGPIPDT